MSGDLIDTSQMYLRTVYELEEADVEPKRARIVDRLHQAGPTVSQTVARMERDGLLTLNNERTIELTKAGFDIARDVMRHHRLAECFLVNELGLSYRLAHEEACRWEHVMSDNVADLIDDRLGNPEFSPYGTPIPAASSRKVHRLADYGEELDRAIQRGVQQARFVMIDELPQTDSKFMDLFDQSGIRPGSQIDIKPAWDNINITCVDTGYELFVPSQYVESLRVKE